MANINITRLEPYTALADVYQAAGFADASAALAPRLLDMAFELEWTGRSLLDLACGTGDLACWFSEHGFRVMGVDSSQYMLRFGAARAESAGVNAEFAVGDMRTFETKAPFELVTCLGGSLNYLPAVRDLDSLFRVAKNALAPGKLFVFDLMTIHGLAQHEATDRVVFDNGNDILIVLREAFSYETLVLTRQYTILRYTEKSGWQRAEETHTLRGYPVQAVTATAAKAGFSVLHTLTPDLVSAEGQSDPDQLLFVAKREG